jgi:hypothetical protein
MACCKKLPRSATVVTVDRGFSPYESATPDGHRHSARPPGRVRSLLAEVTGRDPRTHERRAGAFRFEELAELLSRPRDDRAGRFAGWMVTARGLPPWMGLDTTIGCDSPDGAGSPTGSRLVPAPIR